MNRSLLGFQSRRRVRSADPHGKMSCFSGQRWRTVWLLLLSVGWLFGGCGGSEPPKTNQTETRPAEPAVPDDVQAAASTMLGSDAQVLLFGDLASNGKQQFLAANVVPNTPKSTVAGTVVTRAVIAENDDGKWVELMRADEHLKNQKGYLGLTPLQPVNGWKLQYENSQIKGMSLYFTPIKTGSNEKTLPIAVKWNPATKRYQSMDQNYEHFLPEAPALDSPRSMLR
jgi:hypothetical protein